MRITVIGAGYVGLVQAACLADLGHGVCCVDVDEKKISLLRAGRAPFHEPGLSELLSRVISSGALEFSTEITRGLTDAEVAFIAVGTPSAPDGAADLSFVHAVFEQILSSAPRQLIVAVKSTVPVGTCRTLQQIAAGATRPIHVVSNPEFLREGSALHDFMNPDRIIIGCEDQGAGAVISDLYKKLAAPVLLTSFESAEMIKYASNSFLALEISYINSIALLCERVGADASAVSAGMRLDKRIGQRAFLHPGLGYGGSCFPKDVRALISLARATGRELGLLDEADRINLGMQEYFVARIAEQLGGDVRGKKIAVWGAAFKPNTDDVRESPALAIICQLAVRGADVVFFDPIVESATVAVGGLVLRRGETPLGVCAGADALVIATDWADFSLVPPVDIHAALRAPVVIDGRNIFDPAAMRAAGLRYVSIGRPTV